MVDRRLDNIISIVQCRHRLTIKGAESLNSKRIGISRLAGGYGKGGNFKEVTYF